MELAERQDLLSRAAGDAEGCTRCPLFRSGTQTVFGEGPITAPLMMVGEQPGDQEDRQGHPFVGPAGGLLDRVLEEAEIDRAAVYLTNAVKHFKNVPRGKRRIHKKPDWKETQACRWWLDLELEAVQPKVVVALGATAAHSLTGRRVVLSRVGGQILEFRQGCRGLATIHPSAVLRAPDGDARARARAKLLADLAQAKTLVEGALP